MTQKTSSDRLGETLAFGAIWMIGARFAARTIGLVSTVILARLLMPEDFGIVALAMMIVGLLKVMTEFGFDMALIQNQQATREHYDTVWTLSLIRGLATALLMLSMAKPASIFFDEPKLLGVMQVLALAPLLLDAANPATANFRKHFTFAREFLLVIIPKFAGFIATVALAFSLQSYWALVFGILTANTVRLISSYILESFRPRISLTEWGSVMNFSKWLLVSTVINTVRNQSSAIIIGRIAGSHTLGIYIVAAEISNVVTANLVAPIKRALYPGFAKIAHDRPKVCETFLQAFGLICLISFPIATGMALTADHIVYVMLGPNWIEAIPFVQVLSIAGMIATCRGHARPIYLALNRPEIGALLAIVAAVAFIIFLPIGYLSLGIIGIAWATVAVETILVVMDELFLRRLIGLHITAWMSKFCRPATAVDAMAAVVIWLDYYLLEPSGTIEHAVNLLIKASVGAIVYATSVVVLWTLSGRSTGSPEFQAFIFIRQAISKVRLPERGRPAERSAAE